ncbi:MAG: RNA polymerase sigma factor [Krumholzibacteria bacterium]|nr:RNA polymerase sigma factor [Candidatus Krumholzibacteria bacterium]
MNAVLPADSLLDLTRTAFNSALRILGDRDEALDIAQDVVVNVHGRLTAQAEPVQLRAYAARAAVNRALNLKRDSARRLDKLAAIRPEAARGNTEGRAEHAQRRAVLDAALAALAERQGEALTLRFLGELSIAEIAAAMGISEGAVKTHLVRGLLNLKKNLEELEGVL